MKLTREQIEEWRQMFIDTKPWTNAKERATAISTICDMALASLDARTFEDGIEAAAGICDQCRVLLEANTVLGSARETAAQLAKQIRALAAQPTNQRESGASESSGGQPVKSGASGQSGSRPTAIQDHSDSVATTHTDSHPSAALELLREAIKPHIGCNDACDTLARRIDALLKEHS